MSTSSCSAEVCVFKQKIPCYPVQRSLKNNASQPSDILILRVFHFLPDSGAYPTPSASDSDNAAGPPANTNFYKRYINCTCTLNTENVLTDREDGPAASIYLHRALDLPQSPSSLQPPLDSYFRKGQISPLQGLRH